MQFNISRKFNSLKFLPRSLVVMRIIAMTGIAIGTATLVIAISIVSGFQREYYHAILDFNAHVVTLSSSEITDTSEALNLISTLRMSEDEKQFVRRYGWMTPLLNGLKIIYRGATNFHNDISFRFEENPGFLSVWERLNPEHFKGLLTEKLKRLAAIDDKGVVGATPFLYREGLVISKGVIKGVVVKGIDPSTVRDVNGMRIDLYQGRTLGDALGQGVILGKALAENLGYPSKINLMVPSTNKKKQFIAIDVAGTFESGLYDYDSQFALMNIQEVAHLFETGVVKATGIEIKLDDPRKAAAIANIINDKLPATYQAITWGELNRDLFEALSLEKIVFSIIVGILVVVAAFNIIGVLVLLICYRAHEVAILKALGMNIKRLEKIFVLGGVFTGFWGTIIGAFFGIGLSLSIKRFEFITLEPEIYFLKTLPIDISWSICGMITLFSIVMCYVTSKIAARRLAALPISGNL